MSLLWSLLPPPPFSCNSKSRNVGALIRNETKHLNRLKRNMDIIHGKEGRKVAYPWATEMKPCETESRGRWTEGNKLLMKSKIERQLNEPNLFFPSIPLLVFVFTSRCETSLAAKRGHDFTRCQDTPYCCFLLLFKASRKTGPQWVLSPLTPCHSNLKPKVRTNPPCLIPFKLPKTKHTHTYAVIHAQGHV